MPSSPSQSRPASPLDLMRAVRSSLLSAWPALALCALALALLSAWLLRSKGSLGADDWFLKPGAAWPLGAWWLPLCALGIFGGLALGCGYDRFYRAKAHQEQQLSLRLALAALMMLSLTWNWGLLGPVGINAQQEPRGGLFNALSASWSDVATEYLGTAYQIENAREFSSSYAQSYQKPRSRSIAHVATHPPGATLFYFACRRAVENIAPLREWLLSAAESATALDRRTLASELNVLRLIAARSAKLQNPERESPPLPVEAIATALLATALLASAPALAVPALFRLGSMSKSNSNSRSRPDPESTVELEARRAQGRGALASALWVLAPTVGLFALTLDALVALGAAWTLALAARYLSHADSAREAAGKRWGAGRGCLLAAGATLTLTGFVSFGALTIGLVVALWLVLERQARALLWLAAGAVAMQIVLLALLPHALPTVFAQAMQAHREATLGSRSYGSWLGLNPLFFALFAGGPVLVGAARALMLKPKATGDGGLERAWKLGAATLGAMLLISLAGSVRGEVERLWMFLLPSFCALSAVGWLPLSGGSRRGKVATVGLVALGAVLLQAAQSLLMAATLAPRVLPF